MVTLINSPLVRSRVPLCTTTVQNMYAFDTSGPLELTNELIYD